MPSLLDPWPYPTCIAHRGGGRFAPENTLEAIAVGAGFGFRAVEFDVQLTADGVPVLFHDDTLERTSDGRGRVCDRSWDELRSLDAGSWFAPRFAGVRIPSLTSALDACAQAGLQPVIELKCSPGQDPVRLGATVAVTVAQRWRSAAPALLISFSVAALVAAHRAAEKIPRALLLEETWPADWQAQAEACAACALDVDFRSLGPAEFAAARQAGYRLVAWTLDDPSLARELLSAGLDSVTSDALDKIKCEIM